ncbi:hypothetical protein Ancab_011913 [Ancistrocladus abbreviatus]
MTELPQKGSNERLSSLNIPTVMVEFTGQCRRVQSQHQKHFCLELSVTHGIALVHPCKSIENSSCSQQNRKSESSTEDLQDKPLNYQRSFDALPQGSIVGWPVVVAVLIADLLAGEFPELMVSSLEKAKQQPGVVNFLAVALAAVSAVAAATVVAADVAVAVASAVAGGPYAHSFPLLSSTLVLSLPPLLCAALHRYSLCLESGPTWRLQQNLAASVSEQTCQQQ